MDAVALIPKLVGKLHDQYAVLGHQAQQHDDADLAVDIETDTRQQQRQQGPGQRQWHRQHDDHRVDPALELRGQYQEYDQERQAKGDVDGRRRFLEFPGQALVADPGLGGQIIPGQAVQVSQGRAQVVARRQGTADDHRRQAVNPPQVRIGTDLPHIHQRLQRHQLPAITGPQEDLAQVLRGGPVGIAGLHDDVVFAASVEIGRDLTGRQHGLQGQPHILHGDVEIGRAFPVNGDLQLRSCQLEVRFQILQVGVVFRPRHDFRTPLLHAFVVRPADHERQGLAEAALPQARRVHRHGAHAGHLGQFRVKLGGHRLLLHRALIPGRQPHDHEGPVGLIPGTDYGQQTAGDALIKVGQQLLFDLADMVVSVSDRRPPGRGHRDDNGAAVLGGRQLLGQARKDHHRQHHAGNAETNQQPGVSQGESQQPGIAVIETVQHPFTGGPKAMAFGRFRTVFEPFGAQHGGQRQGHQAGYDDRGRQREAKFAEQAAHVTAHKGNRDKHRHQGQRGGNHRERHLPGSMERRNQRRLTAVDATLDVFQDHNGVVHHQSDGEDDRQQGQHVDRKPEGAEPDEGPDNGHRNGHRGNQRRPPGTQEHEDHQHHERNGDSQRGDDLADRSADKDRLVITLGDGYFRGQGLANLVQFRPHRV